MIKQGLYQTIRCEGGGRKSMFKLDLARELLSYLARELLSHQKDSYKICLYSTILLVCWLTAESTGLLPESSSPSKHDFLPNPSQRIRCLIQQSLIQQAPLNHRNFIQKCAAYLAGLLDRIICFLAACFFLLHFFGFAQILHSKGSYLKFLKKKMFVQFVKK